MSRAVEFSDKLLDQIYDAATDEELWTPALTEIADLTDSVGGIIFGVDNKVRLVEFSFMGRLCQDALRAYRERHVFNPLAAYMNSSPVGKLVCSDDIMSLQDLQRTALFDEVFRPQGVARMAMAPLAAKDDFQVGCTVCRSARQGPFEADALRLLSQLYPHVRRSLLLGFRLDGYKALQRARFSLIDQLSVGIILLDRATKVVFANAAARSMAAHDGPLRLRNCMLTAASTAHAQRLHHLVEAALRGAPVGAMSIPHPDDGRLLTILVSSVRSRDI